MGMGMHEQLRMGTSVHDDEHGRRVVVTGEVDPLTAPTLASVLQDTLPTPRLAVDLAGVTFLDSSGLRAIVSANKACTDAGTVFVIAAPSDVARRVLEISGLDAHLTIE